MPIYEYYCPDNHRIYSFYAKTFAQGQTVPKCPDNPAFSMRKILSPFAVTGRTRKSAEKESTGKDAAAGGDPGGNPAEDARMEAAMSAMEGEFANVDENDPRAMGRMMRRMSELTGEKLDGEMGAPVDYIYKEAGKPDRLVRFCCKSCLAKFQKNPAKYIKLLDEAAAQKPANAEAEHHKM